MTTVMDEEAIRAVVADYIEGWYDGDAGRMERALHPASPACATATSTCCT